MTGQSWEFDGQATVDEATAGTPTVVSLHFLRGALRRRWRLLAAMTVLGLVLGIAYTVMVPQKSTATVTLLLAHDPSSDPTRAMATDLSLLTSRTVADGVIADLSLPMTAEGFQSSFTARAATDQVLVLNVTAPDDTAAVARAKALATRFLDFRSETLGNQTQVLIDGYNKRVTDLKAQVAQLTSEYNTLIGSNGPNSGQASDVLVLRSQLNSEITTLQQTIEDTTLRTTVVTDTSHVLDAASADPHGTKKRAVLNVAAGLIGGFALGAGLIVFLAVTSGRLRRREEVATALGTPVRVSVGKLCRGGRVRRRIMRRRSARGRDLEVLVHGLEGALHVQGGRRARLVVASIDSGDDAEVATAALASKLYSRGLSVFVVDLSEGGGLNRAVERSLTHGASKPKAPTDATVPAASTTPPSPQRPGAPGRPPARPTRSRPERPAKPAPAAPVVMRPEGVPSLARGPLGLPFGAVSVLPSEDPRRSAWDRADVVLTLAEVDPAVGADHLTSWAGEAVVMVTAGASSAERLRSSAELLRGAGIELPFAVLVGSDGTDESLGVPERPDDADGYEARTSSR